MDTRTELVRLAQAGDPAAAQSLLEQSYPVIYRLALSLLADPLEAGEAAHAAGIHLLENLQAYPGPSAHSAWLYHATLEVCRRRMREERWLQRLPQALRTRLRPGRPVLPGNPGLPERSWTWIREIYALEENQRLVVILRYAHDLLPNEIAQVLNWRDGSVQSRLLAARKKLLSVHEAEGASELELGPEEGLTHRQAADLIASAADFRIADEDAARLKRHLKNCAYCAEAAKRLGEFENELRSALQLRWNSELVPAPVSVSSVFDHRRRNTAVRHSLNLAGGIVFMLLVIGIVLWAPANMALSIIPAAPQPAVVATPSPTRPRFRAFQPTPASRGATTPPAPARPIDNRGLLRSIYPGRIAYIAFDESSDHLFALQPGRRNVQKLTAGFTENSAPVWSPDGSQIAYLAMPQGWGLNQVFVINADGSANRQVSRVQFHNFPEHAFSDHTDVQQVYYPLYGPPHWSADGKRLVSAVWADQTDQYLAVLPLADEPAVYLPVIGLERDMVAWSPDGSEIAYVSQYGQEVWLYAPDLPVKDGQNPHILFYNGSWDTLYGLAWSPDSSRIAVLSGAREQDVVQVDLRIKRTSGEEEQNTLISTGVLTRTPQHNSFLSWSPDGRYLAFVPVFTNNDLVNGRILLVQSGVRGTLRPLVQLDRDISGITWSPDGRWVAYSSGYEVWAASLAAYESEEEPVVRVARAAGFALNWQPVP